MTQAERIIGKFGGVPSLARALGHKNPTTVQGWRERGSVPAKQHQAIWDAATKEGIKIKQSDFAAINVRPKSSGSGAAA